MNTTMNTLSILLLLSLLCASSAFSWTLRLPAAAPSTALLAESQLSQLSSMTVLSIDSGDLSTIKLYADTGHITDATTNPLFVAQASRSGDPAYKKMVDDSVDDALAAVALAALSPSRGVLAFDFVDIVGLAMDTLAVTLGTEISKIVKGFVSTEVDPRLSFDKHASLSRARRIISLYESNGVDKSRILIKVRRGEEG